MAARQAVLGTRVLDALPNGLGEVPHHSYSRSKVVIRWQAWGEPGRRLR